MRTLLPQLTINLRLHFRNRMALLYGYLFPTMFLLAFWTLYRHDQVPLVRHVGELLTITVLGGACFGLPTTLVSERERGVWRRYRLAPVRTGALVGTTLVARYILLVAAGLLQVGLAMALGMPAPRHPVELAIAFTFVAFAFLGVGLVIASLADNVPAVQALGQCIFLPMLIIGGVAVPLQSLPAWAERLSSFFPGRYAVQALQACANGEGLGAGTFSLVALVGIGAAACVAGARLFRWDQEQRFAAQPGKGWVAVALAAWIGVGIGAETRTRRSAPLPARIGQDRNLPAEPVADAGIAPATGGAEPAAPATKMARRMPPAPAGTTPTPRTDAGPPRPPDTAPPEPASEPKAAPTPEPLAPNAPTTWQAVTRADIDRDLVFDRLPPDSGIVTPIAAPGEYPDQDVSSQLESLRAELLTWLPGYVDDPVQRTRNLLFVAAVPDVAQAAMEAYVPAIVFEMIQANTPRADLIKVLYWIAVFPERGTLPQVSDFVALGLRQVPPDEEDLRNRAAIYGVKLLGRLTGQIR
jgi:ABC-2 type transport system permease protein